MTASILEPGALFASVGAALFRRAAHLLGDEEAAARIAEELFVRLIVYGQHEDRDARGRWAWTYRVVTNHCLRQLPDDARPGAPPSAAAPDDMRSLRRLDEATQNIVVLARLDGLSPDELAEVLRLPIKLVRRRIAESATLRVAGAVPPAPPADEPTKYQGELQGEHPSLLSLDRDRDRPAHAAHLGVCSRCQAIVATADRLMDKFRDRIAPAASARVWAAVRVERARRASGPRWKRILWLGGSLVLVSSLALLVARPRKPEPDLRPYAGERGASLAKAAGIQIGIWRGEEVRPLDPNVALRTGDRLHFRVRLERPRYLELRVRSGGGDMRVFPRSGTHAAEVRPGQALDQDYVVAAPVAAAIAAPKPPSDRLWIIGLFADRPFPLDLRPAPDVEVVPVRVDLER